METSLKILQARLEDDLWNAFNLLGHGWEAISYAEQKSSVYLQSPTDATNIWQVNIKILDFLIEQKLADKTTSPEEKDRGLTIKYEYSLSEKGRRIFERLNPLDEPLYRHSLNLLLEPDILKFSF